MTDPNHSVTCSIGQKAKHLLKQRQQQQLQQPSIDSRDLPPAPKPVEYKADAGKPKISLLAPMWPAIVEVVRVLEFGAKKYEKDGWISMATDEKTAAQVEWTRSTDAAVRHIMGDDKHEGWVGGEDLDPESKLSHLAHAACDTLFALTYQLKNVGVDDR